MELAFEKLPFEYYPPKYGPIGELPRGQAEALANIAGSNGSRNTTPGFHNFMTSAAKETGFPPGNKLNGSPFPYPFELIGGGKEDAIVVDDDDEEENDDALQTTASNQEEPIIVDEDANITSQATVAEQETPTAHSPLATPPGAVMDKQVSSTDDVGMATEENSYQEPMESYEFDDELGLTKSVNFPKKVNRESQKPSPPAHMAKDQAREQKEFAERVQQELLQLLPGGSGEQDVAVSSGDDDQSEADGNDSEVISVTGLGVAKTEFKGKEAQSLEAVDSGSVRADPDEEFI